jgi:6-phosphogluconolactonase
MSPCNVEYLVFEKTGDIWQFMAVKWREISSRAVGERGFLAAALSGGKTPVGFYRHLSSATGLEWSRTHLFFVDERFVPQDSTESNYRMLKETLFDRITAPSANVHPMVTEISSITVSAEKYEEELRAFFRLDEGGIPEFDLVLLGIGEDGHTASLFPATEALKEKRRLVVPVHLGPALHDRITLTLPVINSARNVFFLVSGRRKRVVMRKLRQGHDRTLPAAMVGPERGKLIFLMDRDAAGG